MIVIKRFQRMLPWAAITLFLLVRAAGGADWPQLQGDAGHTGYTDEDIGRLFSEGWRVSVPPTASDVQPVVVGGRVIAGNSAGEVVCYEGASGAVQWTFTHAGTVRNAVASDGERVFVLSSDRNIYALDIATGAELWRQRVFGPMKTAPVVDGGVVFAAMNRGGIVALDAASGGQAWWTSFDVPIFATPAVAGGSVFVLSADCVLRALDAGDGTERWARQIPGQAAPRGWVVAAGGMVFATVRAWSSFPRSIEHGVDLLDPIATEPWETQRDAILADKQAHPGFYEVWAFDTDGNPLSLPVPTFGRGIPDISSPPVVAGATGPANLIYRWTGGRQNDTGGGATVIRWAQHLGACDPSAGDIAPLDNDGRLDGTSGDQAFLISDEGWILTRAGGALFVTSWHGIYGLDIGTHALFPVLLASRAQPSDVMDTASIVLFDEHVAAGHEGGDGRPGAISDGSMYYLAGNTLVAIRGTP